MLNSIFMLGSSYNKNRKISGVFLVLWIVYMLKMSNLSLGLAFPIINALVFLGVSLSINMIKNKKVNAIMSVCSILIWSIAIDTICYFLYPTMTMGQNILGYIYQGLLFNSRYIISNAIVISLIYVVDQVISYIKDALKVKAA